MKKQNIIYVLFLFSVLFIFTACEKKLTPIDKPDIPASGTNMENLVANNEFSWETIINAEIMIYTKDNLGNPISNVKVSVKTGFEEEGGQLIVTGVTNEDGLFQVSYNFESDREDLVVSTDYLGFISEAEVPIVDGHLNFIFGGSAKSFDSQAFNEAPMAQLERSLKNTFNTNIDINYLGTYNNKGVPDYLEDEGDYISQEFLDEVNAALPNQPVPIYHPEYLMGVNEHNLLVLEETDVWITFVHEGAGYKNVLGFYTYDRDSPPETPDDITECTIIFPNVSYQGSGGGLHSGDKVHLGSFSSSTVIGWILFRNAWNNSTQTINPNSVKLYSNLELNPEPNIDYRQHCVLLYDEVRELFLISFEDLTRPGGDNDFNDAVFYATVNDISDVETDNVQPTDPDPVDTDEDSINDSFDDYPDDPNLAFNNYYASSQLFGTLAFEDLWPAKGDYDFNDLVIDYNFNRISNAQNEVVILRGKFVVRAIGASFENGFGFTIQGLDPSAIASVVGTEYTENFIVTNSNGTEAGQSSATIIVFDNAWKHGHGNTRPEQSFVAPDTITVDITLVNPIPADDFGIAPFNPFIIVNKERGKEVHLPNYLPSDLVDEMYFGQAFDDSNPQTGKYYKSETNLPWAINFSSKFNYPLETISIDEAHLKFIDWVLSDGSNYHDWYKEIDGYRNDSKFYQE